MGVLLYIITFSKIFLIIHKLSNKSILFLVILLKALINYIIIIYELLNLMKTYFLYLYILSLIYTCIVFTFSQLLIFQLECLGFCKHPYNGILNILLSCKCTCSLLLCWHVCGGFYMLGKFPPSWIHSYCKPRCHMLFPKWWV